jgi:K+-sensing histidine kinase KdpD
MSDKKEIDSVGRIEVLHDTNIIINTYVHILNNAKSRWDYFADIKSLSTVPLAFEIIKKAMVEAKTRTIRLRFITEITKENISYIKEFMKSVELRHLDGVKGNFGVSDSEYIAISTTDTSLSEKCLTTSIPHAVYSNVTEDIQQHQYRLDTVASIDSGNGIDPEVFPRLFEKFASKSFQGTGLGLFISRNIVEGHDGKIWAENNADGKGATFYFALPIIKARHNQRNQREG